MVNTPDRLLRRHEVEHLTGLKRATIYKRVKENRFPAPVRAGGIAGWYESEIQQWLNTLPRSTAGTPGAGDIREWQARQPEAA